MSTVNLLEAKTNLSRLVKGIELGEEQEVIIMCNGHPVAKLVPIQTTLAGKRLGVAKDIFTMPENIDAHNVQVATLFTSEVRPTQNLSSKKQPSKKL